MVSEPNNEKLGAPRVTRYQVRVGHEVLIVRGLNRSEAIREARRRLCMELPRMWDVIQGLDESRFGVEIVQEGDAEPVKAEDEP